MKGRSQPSTPSTGPSLGWLCNTLAWPAFRYPLGGNFEPGQISGMNRREHRNLSLAKGVLACRGSSSRLKREINSGPQPADVSEFTVKDSIIGTLNITYQGLNLPPPLLQARAASNIWLDSPKAPNNASPQPGPCPPGGRNLCSLRARAPSAKSRRGEG